MAQKTFKKEKMIVPTFDWDFKTGKLKAKPEPQEYAMDFSDANPNGQHFGMPITVNAFHELLKAFLRDHAGKKPFEVKYVEFSKTSINRVLLQPGCEFVRFYFVFPEKDKLSLVLEGLDESMTPINFETNVLKFGPKGKPRAAVEGDPHYEEKGNGVKTVNSPKSVLSKVKTAEENKSVSFAVDTVAGERNSLMELLKAINT